MAQTSVQLLLTLGTGSHWGKYVRLGRVSQISGGRFPATVELYKVLNDQR